MAESVSNAVVSGNSSIFPNNPGKKQNNVTVEQIFDFLNENKQLSKKISVKEYTFTKGDIFRMFMTGLGITGIALGLIKPKFLNASKNTLKNLLTTGALASFIGIGDLLIYTLPRLKEKRIAINIDVTLPQKTDNAK